MTDETPYGRKRASVEYWSTHRNKIEELYPSEEHFLIDRLKKCSSVLDVGCAAGGFVDICRSIVPELKYTGLEVSPNLADTARDKYQDKKTRFYVYDGRTFPEEVLRSKFDMAYSFGVLHHVEAWDEIVQQMLSVVDQYVCFDLRLSYHGSARGYQVIDFNEEWDGVTKIDYFVLDFHEAIRKILDMTQTLDKVSVYGYERPPTDKAVIDVDEVIMTSFCIEVGGRSPRLAVSVL